MNGLPGCAPCPITNSREQNGTCCKADGSLGTCSEADYLNDMILASSACGLTVHKPAHESLQHGQLLQKGLSAECAHPRLLASMLLFLHSQRCLVPEPRLPAVRYQQSVSVPAPLRFLGLRLTLMRSTRHLQQPDWLLISRTGSCASEHEQIHDSPGTTGCHCRPQAARQDTFHMRAQTR